MDDGKKRNFFDDIMSEVGDAGHFQKSFNILYNLIFIAIATMGSFNIVNIFAVPEHWCRVPGRELTNFTTEEWRLKTVPWNTNYTTDRTFSNCRMYNSSITRLINEITECLYGWEYDRTYYQETIPSQENWVCDKDLYTANALTFSRIGEIIGTFIFGVIGDYFGRKPQFYLSVMSLIIGRLLMIVTTSIYPLFLFSIVFGSLSALSIFQSLLVISMEITNENHRAYINFLQSVAWTVGLCTLPIIYWLVGHWIWVILLTTLSMVPFLFCCNYIIESPRWLAGKGKTKKCVGVLKQIAKINKRELSDSVLVSLTKEKLTEDQNYGVFSLFASRQLAKITVLMIIGWSCCFMIYIILIYNINSLGGNPHMNFFWQGLAELPGYIVGKYMSDYYGRKMTRFVSFIGMALVSVGASYFIHHPEYEFGVTVSGIILKLLSSLNFYAINLHTLEIYPTCLRQIGSSICYIVASIFGCFTPYIVYLGTTINPTYPYIFATILALMGGIFGLFLPETLNERLPETIEEVENFGRHQKLLTIPKRNKEHEIIDVNVN